MENNAHYNQLARSFGEIAADKDYEFLGPDPYDYFLAILAMGTSNVQHVPILYDTYVVPNGMLLRTNERTKELLVMVWSVVHGQYFEMKIYKQSFHSYVHPAEDGGIDMAHLANAVLAAGEPFAAEIPG